MPLYLRPTELADALAALAQARQASPPGPAHGLTVLAGGTDIYPGRAGRQAWLQSFPRDFLDVTGIPELRGIREDGRALLIGAATTFTEVAETPLPRACDALSQAAVQIGGRQIQNRATLGGNIVNASPAADSVPPLLALDASVEIASSTGRRSLPLAAFIRGNRRTALAEDELVVAIRIPAHRPSTKSVFLKLGARSHLVISIASVALVVDAEEDGTLADIRITVGACSEVPARLAGLEAELRGEPLDAALLDRVTRRGLSALSPIDDVRASAAYRHDAARILIRRALAQLAEACGLEAAA